jgi:hypothetical protein
VEVGLFNTKFIEVAKGLSEGDRVLLSPPFDSQDKDLEGAVLAADERAKFASTNKPVQVTPQAPPPGTSPGAVGEPIAAAGFPAGDQPRGEGGARSGRRGFNPEAMMKEFDKNGDGQLDDTEREAMRTAMAARFAAMGGTNAAGSGKRPGREEMLKRFDKNGDGTLDEDEQAAMRESFGNRRGGAEGGGRPPRGAEAGAPARERPAETDPPSSRGS